MFGLLRKLSVHFMVVFHIWQTDRLWCAEGNEGFRLPRWHLSQRSRSKLLNFCLLGPRYKYSYILGGYVHIWYTDQWRSQNAEKICTSKGDYWIKQRFSSITSLFKLGTSLKGKNLLPEGANSFLLEQLFMVWKITFTTLGDPPWMLLFLSRMCVTA